MRGTDSALATTERPGRSLRRGPTVIAADVSPRLACDGRRSAPTRVPTAPSAPTLCSPPAHPAF